MDDKNLFNRQNGQGIRGRISTDQRSTVLLDEPMITDEYRDYQYSEPVDKQIETDNEKLGSKDSGFFRSLNKALGLSDIKTDYTSTPTVDKKDVSLLKSVTDIGKTSGAGNSDELFSFLNGVIDTRIGSKQGDLLRNNIDLQDKLDHITNTVNKAKEAKSYEQEMAQYENDPEQFNKFHNLYENALREYSAMKPTADTYLKEFHEQNKDINGFSDISKIKSSAELENYLNTKSSDNHKQIDSKLSDINDEQGTKRYLNSVYSITPEYQNAAATTKFAWSDPSSWKYTIPQTLGSSFSFMEATAVGMTSSLAGNYMLKQIPKLGMTGGASMLAGLAVSVGASAANVWSNIAARQQESNAEVFDNYKQKLYAAGDEGKFDVDAAIQEGANKLEKEVGLDTSNMTPDQILDGMISYNVNIATPGFNEVRTAARKDLDKLYDQNMALAISDVAQSFLIVPGAGKLLKKAVTLNGKVKLGEDLARYTEKFIDNTTRSIATNMSKLKTIPVVGKQLGKVTQTGLKRVVNKGLTPAAKIGLDAIGEMNEEGVQYIQGKRYAADKYKDQPSNIFKALISNFDSTIDAFSGLLGVSADPALNNDVDLAQNMKLGAVVSFILGGGAQVLMPGEHNVVKQYLDDVSGSNIARNLTADHIKAKEDMETIKRYAAEGLNNESKREGYINQLEEMKNALPPGLDNEDIDIEVKRAKKAFAYLDSPIMNSFASDLAIEKGTDKYNTLLGLAIRSDEVAATAQKNYISSKKKYDNLWNTPEVEDFFDQHNIAPEARMDYLQYIKMSTEARALNNVMSDISAFEDTFVNLSNQHGFDYNPTRLRDYQYELADNHTKLESAIKKLSSKMQEQYGEAPQYDRIDDVEYATTSSLPSVFMNATRTKEATDLSDAFRGIYHGKVSRTAKSIVDKALFDYEMAQEINEQANTAAMDNTVTPEPVITPVEDNDPHIEETAREAIKPENQAGVTVTPSIDNIVVEPIVEPSVEVTPKPVQVITEEEIVAEKPLEQATEDTVGASPVTLSYLLEGGKGSITSTGYFLHGVAAAFPEVTDRIESIRNAMSKEDLGMHPSDFMRSSNRLYGDELTGIREIIEEVYGTPGVELFDELTDNASGFIPRDGADMQRRLDFLKPITSKPSAADLMSMMSAGVAEEGVSLQPEPANDKSNQIPEQAPAPNQVSNDYIDSGQSSNADTTTEPIKKGPMSASDLMDMFDAGTPVAGMDEIIPTAVEETEETTPTYSSEDLELEQELRRTEDMPTDEATVIVEEPLGDFGLTSGTVYFTGKAMFPGFEDAAAFDAFLSQPDALTDADVRIVVGEPGAKYNEKFNPSDKDTWNEAAIYITVEKNGKKYAGALKTIPGALQQYAKSGKEVDIKDVNRLREFRNEILEAYLVGGKDAVIKPSIVKRTNGLFNVNRTKEGTVLNRPLTQITGFNLPKNLKELSDSGIIFGIGRGLRNHFYIVDETGHMLNGIGASGKIYIYPRKEDTPSGMYAPPIKLNELKFKDAPDLTELLYHSFVEMNNSFSQYKMTINGKQVNAEFSNMDVTKFLVNEGEHTLVFKGNKDDFGYLTSKQLYFDREHNSYIVGDNVWPRPYLLSKQGKADFINYVNENFHVNTDETTMFEKLPFKFYRTMYMNKVKTLSLSPTLTFTQEDLNVESFDEGIFGIDERNYNPFSQLEWMLKKGWLKSDLQDQLFKSPFLYVKGVELEIPKVTQEEAVEQITANIDPVNTTGDNTGTFMDDPGFREWFGLDLALPRALVTAKAKEEHTERAKKWLMKKLGLTEDQVLVGDAYVRAAANGTMVMGTTYRDSIALADATVPGTGYHEAFHRVSTLLMSKAQQSKLYSEYRRANPDKRNYTDLQVEEALAEDFRALMLKREKPIYSILKWFNPIITFIRKVFKPDSISTIYDMISNGNFAKYKMDPTRYAEFENAYKEGLNFTIGEGENAFSPKAFPDLTSYYQTIKTLAAALLYKNGVRTLSDVSKIQTSVLRNYLGDAFNKANNANRRVAIRELLDHFDTVIMPDVMEELSRMAIRAVDENRYDEMVDKDAVNVQIIQNYDKAAYEVSKKDNALASAKMFIGTIPKVNFVYNDVDGVKVRSAVPQLNSLLGLPDFVDFDTSWNLMLNNLYDVETYTDMVEKTKEKSKESPFFFQLYKRLSKLEDTNLQTQLLQTVKSNKHNMIAIKYGTRASGVGNAVQVYWTVDDSAAERATRAYPATWSQVFYNSDLVTISEEGSTVNAEAIDNICTEYKSIVAEIKDIHTTLTDAKADSIITNVVKLLNRVGIAIDTETVNSLLTDPKIATANDTRTSALYKLITDTRNGSLSYIFTDNLPTLVEGPKEHKTAKGTNVRTISNVYEGLGKNSIINLLAKHYAQLNPNPEEMSVLGANNNLLYPISQNCYMSDQVRWLNNDPNAVKQLDQVTYCTNSMIKEAVKSKHSIRLNTFVNFKSEEGGDKGRDYMQISPIEDYLSKMTLTANNHIVLPTMADKKMYFTISGVKLFNDPIVVDTTPTGIKLSFSNDTVNQFIKVGLDELNTIIKYYNNKELVANNKDFKTKNYHSSNLGGRFRHFTHISKTVNGVTELISLNEMLDKAEKNGTIEQTLESLRKKMFSASSDSAYVNDTINGMLKYLMATEVASCENLGIIGRNSNGTIENKLLDQSRFNDLVSMYSTDERTKSNAKHYAALSMIGNYAINSALSIIEFEKVFSGDPAFYKNTDDKIKRLSEVLSTGDNLRQEWPTGHRLANRQQFTATELNDNEIASHQFDELKELFTRSYARKYIKEFYGVQEDQLDSKVSDENSSKVYPDAWREADKAATAAVSAYGFDIKKNKGNINQADAAVYIRPEMYRDIMEMLGEWSPEIARAYDIMESDEDWLNNPTLYHESLQALIKPLKMMYYGQHLVPQLGIQVPIFDKMAMFPMFKVMATGDNRDIYDRMNSVGKYSGSKVIDMVAFGSAIKVGSRSPGVFYTDAHNNEVSDLNKWSVFTQDFKYLRRQLITDPHHAERQMLGTQAAKAALSNLVMDRTYGEGKEGEKLTGEQIKNIAFASINQLSNLGIERVKKEIVGDDGAVDEKKLSAFLIRSAKAKGMGAEILDGLKIVDGKFNLPLSAIADSKWIESAFLGLTNKEAVDINTPGGAFIQMSSFGFKSIKTTTDRTYNNGNRLNLYNPDGSMDAMISINLFSHMIPGYEKKSYIQARQWLIDNNIIGTQKGVKPVAMGYRIPTQGLSSISALRVVDIFPSNIGDTVMLPDEFTALTGSDFDIDKLYIARYNFESYEDTDGTIGKDGLLRTVKKSRKVPFDNSLGFAGNSREALENRLLDMYMMVLTDKSNVDETKLPLDNTTSIVKDEVLPIVDGPKYSRGNYAFKYVSPTFQLNKKYEYSGGKNGIAPFALGNVHHVLTQLTKLEYKPSAILEAFGFGRLDGIDSRETTYQRRDKYGDILYDDNGQPITDIDRGERILDWLSAMINAHVDVAKDPYVIRLNVVQWTYTMANFLLRSGFGRDTFFFLPQPILKDIAAEVQKLDGEYGVDSTKSRTQLEKDAIKGVVDKYANVAKSFGKEADKAVSMLQSDLFTDYDSLQDVMSRDYLIDQLADSRNTNKDFTYYYNQLKVWKVFESLTPYAQEMSELVNLSQVDTKKFGNNLNLQRQFIYRLKSYIYNNKVFSKADLANFFKNTFLDTKIRNSVLFNNELFKGLMITSTNQFGDQVGKVLQLINQSTTKDDTILKIVANELEAKIKSEFFNKTMDSNEVVKDMYYGSNSMAARLSRLKTDILMGKYPDMVSSSGTILNELLNYLSAEFKQVNEVYDSPNIITIPRTKSNDKYLEKKLTKYWQELLDSPHEDVSQFAKDLGIYAFYSSGDNYNKNSFFNLLPNSYRKELRYDEAIQDSIDRLNTNSFDDNLEDLFLNTWYNNNLVREVKLNSDDRSLMSIATVGGNSYPLMIAKAHAYAIGVNKAKQPIYRPFIKINLDKTNNPETTILYKYMGFTANKDEEYVPVYAAVNKKGLYLSGKVIREYNSNEDSFLPFNNLPYKYGDSDNMFEVEEYTDKAGVIKKRYKNVNITNKQARENWKKILGNLTLVEDYNIFDPVNQLTYDDIMNGDYSKVSDRTDKEEVTVPTENLTPVTGIPDNNKFTFKDGTTINTPFALNNQQEDALQSLAEFLKTPQMSNNEITLTGYAGTGKTTIIGLFDKYIRKTQPRAPKYSAVTFRANAVTKMNNRKADTYTLHKLFNISAGLDLSDPSLDLRNIVNEQGNKPKIEYGDLIIIDEASMVSPAFYDFVEKAKQSAGIKVIYVGDPAQLSPIDKKNGTVKLSPVFNGRQGKVLSLTKVERTGDNPILTEATALREGKNLSYVTQLNGKGEGVTYTNSIEEATKFINDAFNSDEFKDNKLYFRVLTGVNDMVPTINNTVRKSIFGDNASQLEVGDLLTGYDNLSITGAPDPDIINSGDYEVVRVTKGTTDVVLPTRGDVKKRRVVTVESFKTVLRDIMDPSKTVTLDISSNNTPIAVITDIANELQMLHSAINLAYRNREYGVVNNLKEFMADINTSFVSMKNIEQNGKLKVKKLLDYGYAQTIHKCLSENSDIFTSRGIVKLKDIHVGDMVNTGDGTYKKVLDKIFTGEKEIVKITTRNGYSLESSKEHRILDGTLDFKTAKEFQINDIIPVSRKHSNPDINIGNLSLDYLIGYIIGDGSYNVRKKSKSRIDITVGLNESDAKEYLCKVLCTLQIPYSIYIRKTSYQFVIENKEFRTKLLNLGLSYASKLDKCIPSYIFTSDLQAKSDMIRGLFDSDGSVNKSGKLTYVSVCKSIVESVQKMLLEFGIISYFTKERNAYYLRITGSNYNLYKRYISFGINRKRLVLNGYTASSKTNVDNLPFRGTLIEELNDCNISKSKLYKVTSRKHLSYSILNNIDVLSKKLEYVKNSNYYYDYITNIETIADCKTYDLEIEDIHQYVANGFVVHNSQGGTYNKVLIYADTIDRFQQEATRQQLKYVAVSRAKENVVILTNKQLGATEEVKPTDKFAQLREEEQGTKPSVASLMSSMSAGNEDVQVEGNSIQNMSLTTDEQYKQIVIDTRMSNLNELIQQRTDIDANALRAEFDSIVESYRQADSDSLNNALMKLLCKY